MDATRFDTLSKTLATGLSRRQALGGLGVWATAAVLGAVGLRRSQALVQDVTPAASPAADGEPTSFLFVQTFSSGTWAPKPGEPGVYTLTLTGEPGQTVYFSDRPQRLVGTLSTERFLEALGFTPADPPNAALVARTDGGEDTLVVELLNPRYDAATGTLTYDARVLADEPGAGLASLAARQQDDQLAEQFGPGGLFIDSADSCGQCCMPCWDSSDCCDGYDCAGPMGSSACYQAGCIGC